MQLQFKEGDGIDEDIDKVPTLLEFILQKWKIYY